VQPDPFTGNYSVKQFGAVGDNSHDDAAAIQSAYDTLCPLAGNAGRTLIYPQGIYHITKPIRVKCSYVATQGMHQNGSIVRGVSPVFIFGGQMAPFPLTTAPDGTQTAMVMNSSKQYWLSLVDLYQSLNTPQPLNGLTALNIRFVFQVNDFSTGGFYKSIISAQSGVFPHAVPRNDSAFTVTIAPPGILICNLSTTGTTSARAATPNSITVSAGAWHTGECDWDGANLTVRLDGVPLASTPATGTLVQTVLQNMTIGTPAKFLDTGYDQNMMDGALSSLQISNVSRAATPMPIKFVSDSSTLALFNFDDQTACIDLCTKARTKNGTAIAWMRYPSAPQIGGPTIDSLNIGGPVVIIGGPATRMSNVTLTAAPYGLYLFNNDYASTFTNIQVFNGGPGCLGGILASNAAGVNDYRDLNLFSQCAISMAMVDYSGSINHAFFTSIQGMQYGLLMVADQANDAIVCTDCSFSEESPSTVFVTPIAISGPGIFTANGGQGESFAGSIGKPLAYFDGITTATFLGFTARIPNNPAPSEFFHMFSAPARPVTVINFFNNLSQAPAFQFPMSNLPNTVQSPIMQFVP
jgi:hypothetical protein